MNGLDVGSHQLLASLPTFCHQICSLQDGDMLLDGGEADWVEVGQSRDGELGLEGTHDDVPPGGVGKGVEEIVGSIVDTIYNHMVVDYPPVERIARCTFLGDGTTGGGACWPRGSPMVCH